MPDLLTNTTTISRALLAQFQEAYYANWDAFPREYDKWNTMVGSDTPKHTFDTFGNLLAAIEMTDGQDFTKNAITQAYETSVTVKQFGTTLAITYMAQMYAKNASKVLDKIKIAGVVKSMLVSLEANGITPWDNAFTVNLADGVPGCSASHPCFDLVGGAGTLWNNLATGPISYDNIEAGLKKFAGFLDHQGKPVPSVCDTIKTHALNQMALKKLFESQYVPLDNQLVQNPMPMLKAVFSNYLTSKTAWFLEDTSPDRPHGISVYLNSCASPDNEVNKLPENRDYVASSAFFMNSGMIPNIGLVGSTGL